MRRTNDMTRFVAVIALALGFSVGCKSNKKENKPEEAAKTTSTELPSEEKPKPKPEARTAKANAEVVKRYGKAYLEADEPALRELLHEDVVFEAVDSLLFFTEPQEGIDADIASAKRMKSGIKSTYEPSQLTLATPDKVAIIFRMHGRQSGRGSAGQVCQFVGRPGV